MIVFQSIFRGRHARRDVVPRVTELSRQIVRHKAATVIQVWQWWSRVFVVHPSTEDLEPLPFITHTIQLCMANLTGRIVRFEVAFLFLFIGGSAW